MERGRADGRLLEFVWDADANVYTEIYGRDEGGRYITTWEVEASGFISATTWALAVHTRKRVGSVVFGTTALCGTPAVCY